MRNARLEPKERRAEILVGALNAAEKYGFNRMTREQVAEAAGCSTGLVTHYWRTMTQLRRAVMRAAIVDGRAKIVAQGLGVGDDHARKAPEPLKKQALAYLAA